METANFDRGDTVTLAIDVIQNPERVLKKIERSGPTVAEGTARQQSKVFPAAYTARTRFR